MRGRHVLKTWSGTQATIALSSAEAELISLVRGASEGVGARSVMADVGPSCGIEMGTDESAAVGVCRRTGVGRIRRLDTRLLRIQGKVSSREVELFQVPGIDNPADMFIN